MQPTLRTTIQALAALSLAACGGSAPGPQPGAVCEGADAPDACGETCTGDAQCPGGFYCGGDETCTADCTPGGGECGGAMVCSDRGQCEPGEADPDGGGGIGPDADCPSVNVALEGTVPTVELLLDRSGSMITNEFGEFDERWLAMEAALADQESGVVAQLQSQVRFGATLYTSFNGDDNPPCPRLADVDPAIDNYEGIESLLADNRPEDDYDTPTGPSLQAVGDELANLAEDSQDPHIIVLATDGRPDNCEFPDPENAEERAAAEQEVIDAAQSTFDKGIQTFVLSVGDFDGNEQFQKVANAGQGLDPDTGDAEFYVATQQDELVGAFNEIVSGVRSCTFDLDDKVVEDAAGEGTVTLTTPSGTQELDYETDWRLVDSDTIEIVGDACTTLKTESEVELDAQFPCGAIIIE